MVGVVEYVLRLTCAWPRNVSAVAQFFLAFSLYGFCLGFDALDLGFGGVRRGIEVKRLATTLFAVLSVMDIEIKGFVAVAEKAPCEKHLEFVLYLFLRRCFLGHAFLHGGLHNFGHASLAYGIGALYDGGVTIFIAGIGVEFKKFVLTLATEIDVEIKGLATDL